MKPSPYCFDFLGVGGHVQRENQIQIMNAHIAFDIVLMIGFIYLAFIPFDKKRVRAPWAKSAFVICAVVGIIREAVGLALHLGFLGPDDRVSGVMEMFRHLASGVCLGILFSLILSGQLNGKKIVGEENPRKPELVSN
jgi:hypothetical protein